MREYDAGNKRLRFFLGGNDDRIARPLDGVSILFAKGGGIRECGIDLDKLVRHAKLCHRRRDQFLRRLHSRLLASHHTWFSSQSQKQSTPRVNSPDDFDLDEDKERLPGESPDKMAQCMRRDRKTH